MKQTFRIYDPWLFRLALIATILGLVIIVDAGYARSLDGAKSGLPAEFVSQLLFVPVAAGTCWLAASTKAEKWKKWSKLVWIASLLLVIAVPIIGHTHNGAKRWIGLGNASIQPAEFAKIAAIIYLAGYFAERKQWPKHVKKHRDFAMQFDSVWVPKIKRFLPAIWVLLAVVLIEFEPDMGTGAVIAATGFAMFVPAGVTRKSILWALAIACCLGAIAVEKEQYRLLRFTHHSQRWSGENLDGPEYQTVQAELAIASGGVFGVGLGAGHAKYVLPETTTDFIWATVGEESGLWGSLLVLGVLCALVGRLLWLAGRAKNRFNMLVLYGVGCWIGIQTCVNIMMANAFLPAIGIPLPFISAGGSSLVALWLAIGVCQATQAPIPANEQPERDVHVNRAPQRSRSTRSSRTGQASSPSLGHLKVTTKADMRLR